jgi:hypothetical protein
MSYDHNIYLGWYAEFEGSKNKREAGTKTVRFCPTSKKHSTKDKFCPQCGKEIETTEEKVYSSYVSPHQLQYVEDQEELTEATLGKLTMKDLKDLEGTHIVFPEFLDTKKSILMVPGFKYVSDISRSDGFVKEIKLKDAPSQEWVERMKFIFDVEQMDIKFGIIMEVV